MSAAEHFQAGRIAEAIAAATAVVKAKPGDGSSRFHLCELLCFAGEMERADKQLDAISQIDVEAMPIISLFRQLLRAEQARSQFHQEGRLPEFLTQPSDELQLRLRASILIREKDFAGATQLLEQAEQSRTRVTGTCNGEAFDDIRDLDDLTSSFLEVLTSTGKYYWIPFDSIELIEFHPPERARDLLWRQARMSVKNGPDGEVYLPVLYSGSAADSDNQLRLGRATDWRGEGEGPIRGVGQKMFMIGETPRSIMELTEIEFSAESENQ